MITYTLKENFSKNDPLYLQNITYDLNHDLSQEKHVEIKIIIPDNISAHIIDDLKFSKTLTNKIEIILGESSTLTYQFFVANHHLCDLCDRKKLYDCQKAPDTFEKEISVILKKENSQAYIKCHYLGERIKSAYGNKSLFKLTSNQYHEASNTTSKVIIKSVLDEQAKFVTTNTVHVDKNLREIIAEQENKNLLLHDSAHVITTPQLNINSHDVSCSHGATIKTLEEEELFYLQARGISKQDSERMLIETFLKF